MAGFVFFDTETTGLRPGWDQIVHFAAIRTDADLNEIDRFEARCRLQPHVVPHPIALLTNGLSIAGLCDRELQSHHQMMCDIGQRLAAWSPAIFVGYNSISFDEHMLRHALFQSLHNPYLTSRPGNGRADALGLALAAFALPPHCIAAPLASTGRPVFKLGKIAEANGLSQSRAHDALSDVSVTLEICRLIRSQADDVWQRFVRFSNKAAVDQFTEAEDGFVLTEFYGNEAYHRVVSVIGREPRNPNSRLCLDLAVDPATWGGLADEEISNRISEKGGPLRRLSVNAAPTITPLWDASDHLLGGLDPSLAEDRARVLKLDETICKRLSAIHAKAWPELPQSPHVEEQLYSGQFPGPHDEARRAAFHNAGRAECLELIDAFDDPRLKTFARRLLHIERRSWLDEADRRKFDHDLADRLVEDRGGALTLGGALELVDDLIGAGAEDPLAILPSYRAWLDKRARDVAAFKAS